MSNRWRSALLTAAMMGVFSPAFAQQSARPDCANVSPAGASTQAQITPQAPAKEPATAPAQGEKSGTEPGGAGSTGWTGGLGGSYVGTVPSGPNEASPSIQPEVATGLDPMKSVSRRKGC
jgi:hypothetical protein